MCFVLYPACANLHTEWPKTRDGQNHTYIRIYVVCMVFLAGKSPYIRSIYGADIRFWPTLPKTHPLLDALEILRSSLLCLNFAVSLAAHLPYLCEHAHKKKGQVSSPPAPPSCTHTHTHTHTHHHHHHHQTSVHLSDDPVLMHAKQMDKKEHLLS